MFDENDNYIDITSFIPVLQKAVTATFKKGEWKEFGYETGCLSYIEDHHRLLQSLHWGDDDYEGCVYDALEHIVDGNYENFRILTRKENIKRWIKRNNSEIYNQIYEDSVYVPTFKPSKLSPKEVVKKALADAESFISAGKPESAVDRVHTALHGYLQAVCEEYSVAYQPDDNITRLYKLIRNNVTAFDNATTQADEIKKIMNSLASCVDALNTLRNHASIAHPNDGLLGSAEATLAINAASTLLYYIDGKLH